MEEHGNHTALIVALALAAGVVAQSVAQHLRIPGIVVLVATGILLGPDGLGIVEPDQLGDGLRILVGFAIAVILFEGGLNLQWRRLAREAQTIRRLVTLGAIVTWIGGSCAVHFVMGWDWTRAVLFGSLVIVTGPTVITPILRRTKVRHNLETILEAEGVFIDAVGALIAVITLEVALGFSRQSLAVGFVALPTRLIGGAVLGFVGGVILAGLLRIRGVVPEKLENVFTLSLVLALFQASNSLLEESGIVAVIVAGLVVGNSRARIELELKEFKEQLTVMLIGLLFVLLAADVPVSQVLGLSWPGVAVVGALMLVVRPVGVWACTWNADMTWRERAFLSWLAPRGIVAAAVATVFYDRMEAVGLEGGATMRALVFLVIAVTVVVQGGTAGLVARALGVRRPRNRGFVVLGAHPLGLELARSLGAAGAEVVLLDANPDHCYNAEAEGFRVLHGNALEERLLLHAELDTRQAAIAVLQNQGINLLFARKALDEYEAPQAHVALQLGQGAVTPELVHDAGAAVLFADETDVELWDVRVRRKLARRVTLQYEGEASKKAKLEIPASLRNLALPLAVVGDKPAPAADSTRIVPGLTLVWLVFTEREEDALRRLAEQGWVLMEDAETPA